MILEFTGHRICCQLQLVPSWITIKMIYKKLKLIMLNKNKLLLWNNQKLMNLNKNKLLSLQRNRKMIKMMHQPPQPKIFLTQLKKKRNQGKIWLKKSTHFLSQQEIILTQSKRQRNQKHPQKQLIPPKVIK